MSKSHWLISGEHVPGAVTRVLGSPLAAWALALVVFVLGAAQSLFPAEIRDSARRFFLLEWGGGPDWTASVWALGLGWALAFYLRLIAEADERRGLERGLLRAPNPSVWTSYEKVFRAAAMVLSQEPIGTPENRLRDLTDQIRKVLRIIALLAADFSGMHRSAKFRANIMLVESPSTATADAVANLRFMAPETNVGALFAVLVLPAPLYVEAEGASDECSGIEPLLLALPVPKYRSDGKSNGALPGAPFALLTGQLTVQEDTASIEDRCRDLAAPIREDVVDYFAGKRDVMQSFLSIRIGDGDDPVGVLSIDCDQRAILGVDEQHYATFRALLAPFLGLLLMPVARFARERSALLRAIPAPAPSSSGTAC